MSEICDFQVEDVSSTIKQRLEKEVEKLIAKEKEVYDYICLVKKRDGNSPSVRDIQAELGIKSTASVHTLLTRLEEKGYISRSKSKNRSMMLNESLPQTGKDHLTVPVIGNIAAGKPILASENHQFYVDFPKKEGMNVDYELFGLNVKGESMIGAGIMNGDIVIVAKTDDIHNGDIIAAIIEDEATVKRFYKEDGHFRLQPENPTMEPIIVDEMMVLGKVVSVVRYY